jgi:hypothetical protein
MKPGCSFFIDNLCTNGSYYGLHEIKLNFVRKNHLWVSYDAQNKEEQPNI